MSNRDWFPTYSGLKFYPLKPEFKKINIGDIAHQLSLITRFGGATKVVDSVAQHSVLVSMYLEREGHGDEASLWGLLHDAAETYLGDMKRGVKHLFPGFISMENVLLKMIITKYGLIWPMPKIVKEWDWIIGCNEAFRLVKNGSPEFFEIEPVQKVFITPWTPQYSEDLFLKRFELLKSRQPT